MKNYQFDKNLSDSGPVDGLNLKFITIAVIVIVMMLTVIYSIQQYISAKKQIIHSITEEAHGLEKILFEELEEASYLLLIMAKQLAQTKSTIAINNLFKSYTQAQDISDTFSIKNIIWINDKTLAIADYRKGVWSYQHDYSKKNEVIQSKKNAGRIVYNTIKGETNEKILVGTISITDPTTNQYLGSLQAYFNTKTLKQRLYERTKHYYTSFAIIDSEQIVFLQSDYILEKYLNLKENAAIPPKMLGPINGLVSGNKEAHASYLNSITGQNYYLMKLGIAPFILLVNADPEVMKHKIIKKIWFKFVETSAVSFGFLLLIVAIYKREVLLRRKAEESYNVAAKAWRDKSDFLAYTAHEIRSPLGFILTGSEMMKNQLLGPMPKEYREYVAGIYSNAQSILDFITDILDEDQIVGGNFKIFNKVINLSSLVRRIIRNHKVRFDERKIIFKQTINRGGALPLVICDIKRMGQVLSNLMSNAVKYSSPDSVITVELGIDENTDEMVLSIIDQGVGMSEEEISIALAKYGTVRKQHESHLIESYGLGLAIVKMLVEAHGFILRITSKTGVGTKISIVIPKHSLIYSNRI